MKTKNLIIGSVWAAITIIFTVLMVLGSGYSNNPSQWLINTQSDFIVVFIVALIFSGAIMFLPDKLKVEPELVSELKNIRSKLDALNGEVNELKKIIEE
jgi:hypothetical protein